LSGERGSLMSGTENTSLIVEPVDNPLPNASLGWVGTCVEVELPMLDGVPRPSSLRIKLGKKALREVDPSSVRVFYIEPETGTVLPVPGSGIDPTQRVAFAEIKRAGIYGLIGLPRDRRIRDTIRTLGLWHDHLQELEEPDRRAFIQSVCELILCVGGEGGGLSNDICEQCTSLDILRDGLPEQRLLADWETRPFRRWKPTEPSGVANGQIAYVRASLTPGSFFWVPWTVPGQIYVVDSNGTGRRKLSQGQGSYSQPAWSPQGNELACYREIPNGPFGIVVMASDGSHEVQLTSGADLCPSWSPDGMQLVFVGWDARAYRQLFLVNRDGSNRHQLMSAASDCRTPGWSPDGSMIAYFCSLPPDSFNSLWLIDSDGTNARQACSTSFDLLSVPAWSPDSKRIVAYGYTSTVGYGLFEVEIATRTVRLFRSEDCGGASWAPKGNLIVHSDVQQLVPNISIRSADLHVIKPDGTNDRALPEGPGFMAANPSWQLLIL